MECPWCEFEGSPRELHSHLAAQHSEKVTVEDRDAGLIYAITCPVCGSSYEQTIRPPARSAGFLEEFGSEISLVAFDMLINHMIAEHEQTEIEVPTPGLRTRRNQ